MTATPPFEWLADAVRILHFGFIVFVVGGLACVIAGNLRGWRWVNGWWFRALHLAAIAFVVAESWLDVPCPLTTLEQWLRPGDGTSAASQGFIAHWFDRLFAYQVPSWAFSVTDSSIGLLTLLAWWVFPPRRRRAASDGDA